MHMKAEDNTKKDGQKIKVSSESFDEQELYKRLVLLIKERNEIMKVMKSYNLNEIELEDIFYKSLDKFEEKFKNGKYKEQGKLIPYFRTIVKGQISNNSKTKKSRAEKLAGLIPEDNLSIKSLQSLNSIEAIKLVSQLFDKKLGERCRKVLLLRHCHDMKQKEIVEELGLTLGVVKNNSSKCMNDLKKLIEEDADLEDYLKRLLND